MRYELCSRYRNRNIYPSCGEFKVEINTTQKTKYTAIDPVCISCPVLSWRGGFTHNCTVTSYQPAGKDSVTLVLNFITDDQSKIYDFYAGCELTSTTLNRTIIKTSEYIAVNSIRVTTSTFLSLNDVANPLILSDFTDYSIKHVRAPTNFDIGLHKILYNERLNNFVNILRCDMETRDLAIEGDTTGWLANDNVNVRSEQPLDIFVVTTSTLTTITLPIFLDEYNNIGDWVRIREPDYSQSREQLVIKRRITQVQGQIITIYPPLQTPLVPGVLCELLSFSYDNTYPVRTYDVVKRSPFKTYLETISIPDIKIRNNSIYSNPTLYLAIDNPKSPLSNKYLINSNNINVQDAIWAITKKYSTDKKFNAYETQNNPQSLILNVDEVLYAKLMTHNGEIFTPLIDDNVSPQPSWEDLNFSLILNFDFEV